MSEQQKMLYGGQAIIEGVMFGGKYVNVSAVRKKDQTITYYEVPKKRNSKLDFWKKIPFLRGIVGIIESSIIGTQHLNFSTDIYAQDEEGADQKKETKKSSLNWTMILGVAVAGIISFAFGKIIFTIVPTFIENFLFAKVFENKILHNIVEGTIKISLLLLYLWIISKTPLIKRLFQYHGAEHKVISAYEADTPLTVENVQKFSRLHYRCGSSFIVLSVILSVILYSFFSPKDLIEKVLLRIYLIPVVLGVSYEFLRLTNALKDVPVLQYLGYPGLWLQKLTTQEPLDEQVEVSIASFEKMLSLEEKYQHNQV